MLLQFLYPLNSAANPVIFIVFNVDIFCKWRERTRQPVTEELETQPTTV